MASKKAGYNKMLELYPVIENDNNSIVLMFAISGEKEHQELMELLIATTTNWRRKQMAKAKLGSGARFKALTQKVEKEGKSPEVAKKIAAAAGIKKYGQKRMSAMAAKGKKK